MEQAMIAGRSVGVIGLGAWQLGADWGEVEQSDAVAVLSAATAAGSTFIDTADVYGDGRSEQIIGEFLRTHRDSGSVMVATKMGRRADQQLANYSRANLREWNERSRQNLRVDTIDLVQLHCPPNEVYSSDAVFDALDELVSQQRVSAYGLSVETCDQAMAAMQRSGVASIQIVVNCLRQKPLEEVLPTALAAGVAIIARVPLASGLLSGRYNAQTQFAADDHRNFNRNGEAFDVGETFAGVPYEVGLAAAEELKALVPEGGSLAQLALRWLIDTPGVTVVIPGARHARQARSNSEAAGSAPLTVAQLAGVTATYDRLVRPYVHARW